MKTKCKSLSSSKTQAQFTKVVKYSLICEPVPQGWKAYPMQGWHGKMGRVILVKEK